MKTAHLLRPEEVLTLSRLGAAVVGCLLSRLRPRLGDSTVLGGHEREGPELSLPVWGLSPPAPQALLILMDTPANITDISTE